MNKSHFILLLWLWQIVFHSFFAANTQCSTLCKSVCLICYPFTSCSSGRLAFWSPWRCPARPVTVVFAHCLDNEVALSHLFPLHSSSLLIEWTLTFNRWRTNLRCKSHVPSPVNCPHQLLVNLCQPLTEARLFVFVWGTRPLNCILRERFNIINFTFSS